MPSTGRTAAWLFLALFGVFALSTGGHTYSSDEEGILAQTRAVSAGRHWYEVTADNNWVTPVRAGRDGRQTGVSGIGVSIVALPFHTAGEVVSGLVSDSRRHVVVRLFSLFTNSAITAAVAVVVFLLAAHLGASRRSALALAVIYGLGTMAWPHAKTLFSEPLAALFLALAVLFAFRAGADGRPAPAAWAGLASGAALMARISTGLFPPLIALYLVGVVARRFGVRRAATTVLAYGLGAVPTLTALGAFNWWRYGSALDVGYEQVPLDHPLGTGLSGLLLSPGKSIFLYAPVVLVALVAVPVAIRRRPAEVVLLLAVAVANVVFFARFPYWHGDHAWGPRYLQIVLPLMVALAAPVLRRGWWRRAAGAAGVAGFVIAGLPGVVIYFNSYLDEVVAEVGVEPLHGEAAYAYYAHRVPRWSPVVGHRGRVDDALASGFDRLTGSDGDLRPYPATTNERYFWYTVPGQLDVWWLWLPAAGVSRWFWLLGAVFAGLSATGWWHLRGALARSP